MEHPQSVIDYSNDSLYIIGSRYNRNICIFNLNTRKYQSNKSQKSLVSIQNLKTIRVTPCGHCVAPIYDKHNRLSSIVSFSGTNNHFKVLNRIDTDNKRSKFVWDTDTDYESSYHYSVGQPCRAININRSFVLIR